MGLLLGFKRAKIQPLDSDGKAKGELIIVEGKQDEGAVQEANITGLSSEPVKVYGSDIAYYVSQKGTGDVSVALKFIDMPYGAEDRMLGYETDAELKSQFVGENTEPPYCAVTLESSDTLGNAALFGFFKGKFNKPDISLKTKEGGNVTPEGESYTFSAIASDADDKSKGNTMVKFLGKEEDKKAVEELVLRTGA